MTSLAGVFTVAWRWIRRHDYEKEAKELLAYYERDKSAEDEN